MLSFERIKEKCVEKDHRDSFSNCYLPNVEIKHFNVFIDWKSFFDLPVKNEEEAYEKIIQINRNNDYTTGNLLDFAYFKENYRLTAIDLSKQIKLKSLNKLILLVNLKDKIMEQQCFSLLKSQKKLLSIFNKIAKDLKSAKHLWIWIFKICNKKRGSELTVNQRVTISTKIQSNF